MHIISIARSLLLLLLLIHCCIWLSFGKRGGGRSGGGNWRRRGDRRTTTIRVSSSPSSSAAGTRHTGGSTVFKPAQNIPSIFRSDYTKSSTNKKITRLRVVNMDSFELHEPGFTQMRPNVQPLHGQENPPSSIFGNHLSPAATGTRISRVHLDNMDSLELHAPDSPTTQTKSIVQPLHDQQNLTSSSFEKSLSVAETDSMPSSNITYPEFCRFCYNDELSDEFLSSIEACQPCFVVCKEDCRNGGVCINPGVCICPPNFGGDFCQLRMCEKGCQNGGKCVPPGVCSCPPDFRGEMCEFRLCEEECKNGGTCVKPGVCSCHPNFKGKQCEARTSFIDMYPEFCHSMCYNEVLTEEFMSSIDACRPCFAVCKQECQNGGTCVQPGVCICPPDFTGDYCQLRLCKEECRNGGKCIPPGVCSCPSDFRGDQCEFRLCEEECQNGGTCIPPGVCSCPPDFLGDLCEIHTSTYNPYPSFCKLCYLEELTDEFIFSIDACHPCFGLCDEDCQNGGTCVPPGVCSCPPDFEGDQCQFIISGLCEEECQNGGICALSGVCRCPPEFHGDQCQWPVCNGECLNGGTCIRPDTCKCPPEFRGSRCQIRTSNVLQCDIRDVTKGEKVGWVCTHSKNETTCKVQCKEPGEFETPIPDKYRCTPDGKWTPSTLPRCIVRGEETKA